MGLRDDLPKLAKRQPCW